MSDPIIHTRLAQTYPLTDPQVDANFTNLKNGVVTAQAAADAAQAAADAATAQIGALTAADIANVPFGGIGGANVQDALNELASVYLTDYAAVRDYDGDFSVIFITGYGPTSSPSGIAGQFVYDPTDTTSLDDNATIIVAINGMRWKRQYTGPASILWFGVDNTGATFSTTALQAAIDALSDLYAPAGTYKLDATVYTKRSGVKLSGSGIGNTFFKFVNASGGTMFAGHTNSNSVISDCCLSGFAIIGNDAATDASICIDITTFSYSVFDLSVQTKRANGVLYAGYGNSGSSPYYNKITGYWFGGNDITQTGFLASGGSWAGGSNGPNANIIGPIYRAASLAIAFDMQVGNGNLFSDISCESIGDYYFKLNSNSHVDSGTSSGSNTQVALKDTLKSWAVNAYTNHAVKITGGVGSGQVRMIKSNTSTQITIDRPWSVRPDATSTYQIYKGAANSNKIVNVRGEGLSSSNPDFIYAAPGTYGNTVSNVTVESLGSGLYVRDDSGSTWNKWFDGSKVTFTEYVTNPGASYSQDIYPRSSLFGGVMLTNYVLEWVSVAISAASPGGTATVKIDAGGTAAGNGDMTMTVEVPNADVGFAMPGSTEKIKRDGTNRHVFMNVSTDASFNATADIIVTWCATIDA